MRFIALILLCCAVQTNLKAQDDPAKTQASSKPTAIELAGGKYVLSAPADWKQVTPKSNIIMYEFSYPADAKAGEAAVRVTVSQSGGGVQGNLERWYGQFKQPDNKSTKELAKLEVLEAAGQKIHFVKLTGTFMDGMPMAAKPPVKRENFGMLGAIIETKDSGLFFVKLTGPAAECVKLQESFVTMLKTIESK